MPSAILMGSKPASVVALDILLRRGWTVPAVAVTPKLSHPWLPGPDLATFAATKGIPVVAQRDLAGGPTADFVISYMFRHRVRAETLELAGRAALNFHAGPLPEFGGWAFYNVAILEGCREYGCTCHYMVDAFDAGDLLKVRRFPIDPDLETAFSLERKAQEEMIKLFLEFCVMAESGAPLPREAQDPARMRYLDRGAFEALKRIPPGSDTATVDRWARAFWAPPYQGASLEAWPETTLMPALAAEEVARALQRDALERLYQAAGLGVSS